LNLSETGVTVAPRPTGVRDLPGLDMEVERG
jgi:hypothetical protein